MNEFDKDFVISKSDLINDEYIVVRYRFETAGDFESAAIALAKEQSFSTIEDPRKEKELIKLYAAKVIIDSVGTERIKDKPTLPSFIHDNYKGSFVSREVDLAYPARLFSGSLSALISMVIGEVHNIAKFTGIKVVDIEFPESWKKQYGGPVFGLEGIRKYLGKPTGPVLISPVKPCVGLTPIEFADRVYECLIGGFDGVKDDELLLDPEYCSFEERVSLTMDRVRKAEKVTGKKKIYFANVGGDIDKVDEMFNIAMAKGVSGIMFSPLINGFDIIKKYKGKVPIIAHNNLTHGMTRHPLLGISFSLWVKIQRLIGADMMISPAPDRSFYVMSRETNKHNIAVAIEGSGLKKTLVGLSGSQTPATLYRHVKFMQHDDFAICPGGAVYEHPGGIQAGAQSFVQAVTALSEGMSLEDAALKHDALRVSLEVFADNKDNFDR